MLLPTDSVTTVRFPSNANRRQFAGRARAVAALMVVNALVIPIPVDERGAPLPDVLAIPMQKQIQEAAVELARGPRLHARKTIEELESSIPTMSEHVDKLLETLYAAHARAEPSAETLDPFLDTFETWLIPSGVAKVDMLFSRVDLDRVPQSLGVLLLATTRLTRNHFAVREAFCERLAKWLVGRDGRTAEQVEKMLEGLRA